MESEHRIVLGLDFGTTHTGIAYGTTASDIQDVEFITSWPGSRVTAYKTPTRIAYASENPQIKVDKWGFEVKSRQRSYTWFKLLLDSRNPSTKDVDLSLHTEYWGIMQLPKNRSASQVCVDYLRGLWEFVEEHLSRKVGEDRFSTLPIDVFMTVPAIWDDAAKSLTRSMAETAGFRDNIKLITEPEAAALTVLHPTVRGTSIDPVEKGETLIVCDCGGGTVDVVTYLVRSCRPLKFEEVCHGDGDKIGSTYIDRGFDDWMARKFGPEYNELPRERRGPTSRLMKSFEAAKQEFSFDCLDTSKMTETAELEFSIDVEESDFYDPKDGTIHFPWTAMRDLFDPIIHRILSLIKRQMRAAKRAGHVVQRIVLVGGFGDNRYLYERLKIFCGHHSPHIKLSCPPSPQAAIMKGAVIRGLEGLKPVLRVARRHYGFSWSQPFRKGVDREKDAWYDKANGKMMAYNRIKWVVKKGRKLTNDYELPIQIERLILPGEIREDDHIELFSCSAEKAPDFEYSDGIELVGQVHIAFDEDDWKNVRQPKMDHDSKKEMHFLDYDLIVNMNADEGVLAVRVKNERRELGEARIEFHYED